MADFDVHYDPITIDVEPTTVTLQGLDNVNSTITLSTPQPLKSETKSELVIPLPIQTDSKTELIISEPIRTESKAEFDVKPLVFDQCLTIRLEPLPDTCIRQPYQQHIGITFFGIEVLGLNLVGENRIIVEEPTKKPHVVWGGERIPHQEARRSGVQQTALTNPQPSGTGRGLRIRLGE